MYRFLNSLKPMFQPRHCLSPGYCQDLVDAAIWDAVCRAINDPKVVMFLLVHDPLQWNDRTGAEICDLLSTRLEHLSIPERREFLHVFGVRIQLGQDAVEVSINI